MDHYLLHLSHVDRLQKGSFLDLFWLHVRSCVQSAKKVTPKTYPWGVCFECRLFDDFRLDSSAPPTADGGLGQNTVETRPFFVAGTAKVRFYWLCGTGWLPKGHIQGNKKTGEKQKQNKCTGGSKKLSPGLPNRELGSQNDSKMESKMDIKVTQKGAYSKTQKTNFLQLFITLEPCRPPPKRHLF